jgi:hypothetical protein
MLPKDPNMLGGEVAMWSEYVDENGLGKFHLLLLSNLIATFVSYLPFGVFYSEDLVILFILIILTLIVA